MENYLSLRERLRAAEILISAKLYEQAILHINSVLLSAVSIIAEREGLKKVSLSDTLKKFSSPEYPFSEPFRRLLELSKREILETEYLREYLKQVKRIVKIAEGKAFEAFFKRVELKTPLERPIAVYRAPLYAALILTSIALDALSLIFPWHTALVFSDQVLTLHSIYSLSQMLTLLLVLLPLFSALLSLLGLTTRSTAPVFLSFTLLASGIIYTLITYSPEKLQLGVIFAVLSSAMKMISCISFGREDFEIEVEFVREETEVAYLELELINPKDSSKRLRAKCRVDLSQEYLVLPSTIANILKLPSLGETEVKVRLLTTEKLVPALITGKVEEPLVGKTLLRLLGVKYSILSGSLEPSSE